MKIAIPNYKDIEIKNILFDYNGTLAKDGYISKKTEQLLYKICEKFNVFVITADTFGTVKEQLSDFDVEVKVLSSDDHTKEKGIFVNTIGGDITAAFGNGNNDKQMLENACVSISITGDEGCSKDALLASDIICKDINEAMELFLYPKRLIATLRK